MTKDKVLEKFNRLGRDASYHYADDSVQEWHTASELESQARELFTDHPEQQPEMREIAKVFLWRLDK